MTSLYLHQRELLDRFPKKHLIAWQVGTGKTIGALALAQAAEQSFGENKPVLIVCPKGVKEKWIAQSTEWLTNPIVVTKEEFKKLYKKLPKPGAVIVDEAHREFAGLKNASHRALVAFLRVHDPEYVWLLTGTPYTSSPWSVYGLARVLGVRWDYFRFRNEFFEERHLGRRVVFQPKAGCEQALAAKVREIGSIVRLDECIDMPPQTYAEEAVELSAGQRYALKTLMGEEPNALIRFGKSHQIAQGILIGDEYVADQIFPSAKIDRFLELCHENPKVIGWSKYNLLLITIGARLEALGIPYIIVNGNAKDREEQIKMADAAERYVILAQSACAEGWEAPSFRLSVFIAHDYSYVNRVQAMGRNLRINRPMPNLYIDLISKNSVDTHVMDALRNKKSFSEAIFAKDFPELF